MIPVDEQSVDGMSPMDSLNLNQSPSPLRSKSRTKPSIGVPLKPVKEEGDKHDAMSCPDFDDDSLDSVRTQPGDEDHDHDDDDRDDDSDSEGGGMIRRFDSQRSAAGEVMDRTGLLPTAGTMGEGAMLAVLERAAHREVHARIRKSQLDITGDDESEAGGGPIENGISQRSAPPRWDAASVQSTRWTRIPPLDQSEGASEPRASDHCLFVGKRLLGPLGRKFVHSDSRGAHRHAGLVESSLPWIGVRRAMGWSSPLS